MKQPSDIEHSARYARYREFLLDQDFTEAKLSGRFYRQTADRVVFAVNLEEDEEDCLTVLYGFTSMTCLLGKGVPFAYCGTNSVICQVRNLLCIWNEESEADAERLISDFYLRYRGCSGKELAAVKRERQRVFFGYFARALKPLGFKRRGTTWTKELGEGRSLSFEAKRSAYADMYDFNVILRDTSDIHRTASVERVSMLGRKTYNWQLMTEEQIHALITYSLETYIVPKLKENCVLTEAGELK